MDRRREEYLNRNKPGAHHAFLLLYGTSNKYTEQRVEWCSPETGCGEKERVMVTIENGR